MTILAAIALSIAIPVAAPAQAATPPAPVEAKKGCCADMKAKMDCCKGMGGDASNAGHDMKPPADAHQNHQ